MNQYIFTPTGFYPDTQEKETLEKRYETLYHMGFPSGQKKCLHRSCFYMNCQRHFPVSYRNAGTGADKRSDTCGAG